MMCPRCETMSLEERDRDGILVDACRQCRGIWLDRGELEKLVARAVREVEEAEASDRRRAADEPPPARELRREADYRREADLRREAEPSYGRSYGDRPRRKKSWAESLTDLFD